MRFKHNLQVKILIYILSTILLVFMFVGLFVGLRNSRTAVERAHEYTKLTAEKNANEIKAIFNQYIGFVSTGSKLLSNIAESDSKMVAQMAKGVTQSFLNESANIENSWVLLSNSIIADSSLSSNGWSLIETKSSGSSSQYFTQADEYLTKYKQANHVSISEPFEKESSHVVEVYAPIFKGTDKIGIIGFSVNLKAITNLIAQASVYEGGNITVLSNSAVIIGHTNQAYLGKKYAFNFTSENETWSVEKKIAAGSQFEIESETGNDIMYSVFIPLRITETNLPWSIEATIPMSKIMESSKKSIATSVIVALVGFIIIIIVVYLIMSNLIKPIKEVTNTLNLLSKGNLKDIKTTQINSHDELQEMADNLNHVVNGLKKTENFALEIGNGNLENEYSLLGEADQLGKALMDMRNRLKKNILEDEKRKKEDEKITWATNGIARFAEILRQDNTDMKKLGYNIISNLVDYLHVHQGAAFVLNEDDPEYPYFDLATAIAFGRDKFMKKEIKIGEGLVGRCAYEKKTIFLKEVPADYPAITSGLGDSQPGCILIVPCILNDAVFGVIELASFTQLQPHEIEFVEKLGESIGATISSVRINLKTSALLSASQNQSEELAAQEEELRQNLEEMEATQEDLKRQMDENTAMRENLTRQNALLDALLFSLPDLIYFKDVNSKFLRISKSMIKIFGAKSVDDIVGKSDFDFHTPENAQKYFDDEKKIMQTGKGITNQLQKETYSDGSVVWNSVTKLPLLTADGTCIGTFGISKDVTEIKNMEIEAQRKTALLDALLKSLPDYIYFKDEESKFLRISDSMLHLFGANSIDEVIGKSDFDFHTPENAQQYFEDEKKIMATGEGITNQLQREIKADGSVIWNSVTKLPLINTDGKCIGTFGISKDVTKIKLLELESNKQKTELSGIIEAVKHSTFTIEYDTKGFITDVNDELLTLLQLERKKVIGMHHKDGLDLSEMSNKEYEKFWNGLLNGEVKSMENKMKVNNKEIYLSETYSPIKDENNKVVKIIKIAFDITQYLKNKK